MNRIQLLGLILLPLWLSSDSLCSSASPQELPEPIQVRIGIVDLSKVRQSVPVITEIDRQLEKFSQLVYFLGGHSELWPSMPQGVMEKYHRDQEMIGALATQRAILTHQIMQRAKSLVPDDHSPDFVLDKASIFYTTENVKPIDLTDRLLESINHGEVQSLSGWKGCNSVSEWARLYLKQRGDTFTPVEP